MNTQRTTRNLLLFGKGKSQFEEQLTLLKKDSSGMAERDLAVIFVEKEADYKKHNVTPNDFTLLLIGKDGGEKLRSTEPVEPEKIFKLIDSMPMRQAEIENSKN
jgi:hypothetical protein